MEINKVPDGLAALAELVAGAIPTHPAEREELHRAAVAIVDGHGRLAESLGVAVAQTVLRALQRTPRTLTPRVSPSPAERARALFDGPSK